ncbi:amine oxidase [Gloeopeniophorella convolvens]|nr:amine oxidase [Gloeopeniophorella convolvens]
MRPSLLHLLCSLPTAAFALPGLAPRAAANSTAPGSAQLDAQVLVLGGGVSGIIAARALHAQGITDFIVVEARDELGGRMRSASFGAPGNELVVELGANWVQGTQEGDGPANPILTLARKHGIKTELSDFFDNTTTYDVTGPVDFLDVLNNASDAYDDLVNAAGARIPSAQVDLSARAGYSLLGDKPRSAREKASEYFLFDFEYAQTPAQSSWLATAWNDNFTFDTDVGGFSDDNLFSIDQRGFKHLIQAEAAEFLTPAQTLLNTTVAAVAYSDAGVSVTLANGTTLRAAYAICTFSLGVLQNDDVQFEPAFPSWKAEAVESLVMATYTKIFLQFPENFWFGTQFGLYADPERGRYPVWQNIDLEGFLPGSRTLFVTVTGDFSERIEALPEAQVQSEVLGVLQTMFPHTTLPAPSAFLFPRWHSDPLYRGSYSNWPASFVPAHHTNLRATLGRLWFAGEALSEKYFGFLHGAYFEGEDAGNAVAACVLGTGCAPRAHIEVVANSAPYDV